MLDSILSSDDLTVTFAQVALCSLTSLLLGLVVALIYRFRHTSNKNFVVTLALLPALVQAVIMLVNGNLGTGVAVMGAFSLVRFRSVPGSAREIVSIFFAMAIGLATGMGYLVYAFVLTGIVSAAMLLYNLLPFGQGAPTVKSLRVTIPEDVDYSGLFDDLFKEYTRSAQLERVKTTNLGSLFELQYKIELRDPAREKKFLDEIRMRNANLTISCGLPTSSSEEL